MPTQQPPTQPHELAGLAGIVGDQRSLAATPCDSASAVATNEYRGNGKERTEYHNIVVWV